MTEETLLFVAFSLWATLIILAIGYILDGTVAAAMAALGV